MADKYMKIRQQFFEDRVNALRFNKWQVPMKNDPKIKGVTLMYFYTEKAVEELIMRLRLASGLSEVTGLVATDKEPK